MKELALHILDIAENSIEAGASRVSISLSHVKSQNMLEIKIIDDGRGMNEAELKLASEPFYTSRKTRKVGLGIPLFRQHAEMTGGGLEISSETGKGCTLNARFSANHPDLQPIGDIEGCWALLSAAHPGIDIVFDYETENGSYEISSKEVMDYLGLKKLADQVILDDLKGMIRNSINELE